MVRNLSLAAVLGIAVVATAFGPAWAAQRPAPAARAAPAARPAAAVARPAPMARPAMVARPAIAARPAPSFARSAAPRFSARGASPSRSSPRFSASRPSFSRHVASSPRFQQSQSRSRLSRSERREFRSLRTTQQQSNPRSRNTQTVQSNRLEQLQSRGHLNRSQRRELRSLQRDERRDAQQQQNRPATTAAAPAQSQQARALRTQAVTAQQARQGRFASGLRANAAAGSGRFAGRRAARLAARTAWQLGLLAPYVPWRGPVYWPYAYDDVFYYTFWPDAYDPGYWAYAYDDMFDGVFFPDGAPYAEYAADGPYSGPDGRVTTGSAPSHIATPGRITQATRDFCAEQAKGVAAWPLQQITDAVRPNEDQKSLLENLRKASGEAATRFKDACPDAVPMTPAGRLEVVVSRLQATDEALQTVKPALVAFYSSLTDEQKARFNEIGVQLGQPRASRTGKEPQAEANCSAEKAGISNLTVNRIEQTVRPTDTQGAALDKLDAAMQKAVDTLRQACPDTLPQTPVGRLDVMQKRLEAMIDAANTVRPALEEFYTSLNDEQKAKLNRLGRDTAQGD